MKNDIAIMADPDTVTGFMLGGIKSRSKNYFKTIS